MTTTELGMSGEVLRSTAAPVHALALKPEFSSITKSQGIDSHFANLF
ncbi:MAG: hypothetical protein ACXVIS_07305 [Halobacteriota archaeon]